MSDRLEAIRAARERLRMDLDIARDLGIPLADAPVEVVRCPHGSGPSARCSQCLGAKPTVTAKVGDECRDTLGIRATEWARKRAMRKNPTRGSVSRNATTTETTATDAPKVDP